VDEKEYTPETFNDADVKIVPIIHKGCGEKKSIRNWLNQVHVENKQLK